MPTLRLAFDLDGEVYPELYAALLALGSAEGREERLRQLAAAGLVWEKVRLHGAAATALVEPAGVAAQDLPALPAAAAPDAPPDPPASPDVVTRPDVIPLTTAAPRRAAGKRSRAAAERRRDEFVDLAINAEPTPVPAPPEPPARPERRARPTKQDMERVIRELPVLMDVVADVRAPEAAAEDDAHEQAATWSALNPYPDDVRVPDDGEAAPAEPALHVTALSHKPAARSRLMRMKERGLFKNG